MSDQDLRNEVKLLRQYTKALEIQNDTRNQQRKFLEKQNDKLRALLESAGSSGACKNCDTFRGQIRKLQDRLERIQREKSTLQSSYDSLSKQLLSSSQRNSKVVTSTAITSSTVNVQSSYQYTSLKSKYENSEKQLTKVRFSETKLLEEKIKLQQQVQALESMLSKVNGQLYTLQSSLQLKQGEITRLKNDSSIKASSTLTSINRNQYEKVRSQVTEWTYKYDSLERKYKSLQNNEKQFTKQRTKYQTRISELQKKISTVNSQLYQTKSQIEMKVNEINRLRLQSLPPRSIITSSIIPDKTPELEKTKLELETLRAKYDAMLDENFELKKKGNYSYSLSAQIMSSKQQTLWRETESLKRQNQGLKSEIRSVRLQYEAKFEFQMRQKNQEILRLQMRVESYQQKINEVSEQLEQQIRIASHNYQRGQDPRLSATSSVNTNVLDGQKLFLRSQLNRLTSINQSLSIQIINLRKEYSYYAERHQDMQRRIQILEQTNQSLRLELHKSIQKRSQSPQLSRKKNSHLTRSVDNQVYTIEVNSDTRNVHQSSNFNQNNARHSKISSEAVFRERDFKNTFHNTQNISSSNINDQKWKSLQYKIHKLKSENDELKKTLYDMNDY